MGPQRNYKNPLFYRLLSMHPLTVRALASYSGISFAYEEEEEEEETRYIYIVITPHLYKRRERTFGLTCSHR